MLVTNDRYSQLTQAMSGARWLTRSLTQNHMLDKDERTLTNTLTANKFFHGEFDKVWNHHHWFRKVPASH